jgi:addiction module RelB/DinJ family antitoxin
VDENTRQAMHDVCSKYGITTSDAINMLIAKAVRENKLPFAAFDENVEEPATTVSEEKEQKSQTRSPRNLGLIYSS